MLDIGDNKLVYRYDAEEVWIEAWGPDGAAGAGYEGESDAGGGLGVNLQG